MLESIEHVGEAGEMVSVFVGFFRNFLEPQGKAQKATQQLIQEFKNKQAEELAAVEAEQAAAQAIATALSTIGKFVVKKTVGEDDKIFGSVTAKDCADLIEKQTGKALDTKGFDIPDISTIGVYEGFGEIAPKVTGSFKVDVQKSNHAFMNKIDFWLLATMDELGVFACITVNFSSTLVVNVCYVKVFIYTNFHKCISSYLFVMATFLL